MNKLLKKYKEISVQSRASLWALIAGVFQKGISILTIPIFTRILSTSEYAQYALYQSWQDIFIIFASLNVFNYATYTAMSKFEDDRDRFIVSAQSLVTVLCLIYGIVIAITNSFFEYYLEFPTTIVLLLFVDILFISSYNLWAAKKRFEYKYKIMTFVSVILGMLRPLIGILLVYCISEKGFARIYGVVLINFLIGIILYGVNIYKAHVVFDIKYWNYIFRFCIPLIPHFLSTQILSRFDRIMIGKMGTNSQVAVYSLAYNLATLMIILSDALLTSITPWMYQTIKSKKYEGVKVIINSVLLLVCAGNLLLMLFAPELLYIFAPAQYSEAKYIIPAVSASIFFIFLFNIFANIEYYYSETKYVAFASCGAAFLNILTNYIFIKRYGYIAAGYTTLLCYIIYALCHYVFMRIVCKKHVQGYNFFDNKFITILSCIFIFLSFIIIFLYNYLLIRYCFIFILVLVLFIKRKKIMILLKKKNDTK